MHALLQAPEGEAAVDLRPGLSVSDVQTRLQQGLRLRESGLRILAFYLTEMSDRGLHQETGHSSTVAFARDRLTLPPRRTRELIAVGRQLLTLPEIDRAFCGQRIGWSKVVELARVVTPPHEAAWLEQALTLTCRELRRAVQRTKPGRPPRKPGDRKGLPEVRFRLSTSLDVLAHQKWELAKQKLAAERGTPMDDAQTLSVLTELFLQTEEDGSIPGRTRVDSSLYRVVMRPDDDENVRLAVDSEDGPLPWGAREDDDALTRARAACMRCDADAVVVGNDEGVTENRRATIDRKTPPALRRRVVLRDGGRCRSCTSRFQLMVHHIRYRSRGGRTRAANLITLCESCHALVHADLLVLDGPHAEEIQFVDARGVRVDEGERAAPPAAQLQLVAPPRRTREGGGRPPPPGTIRGARRHPGGDRWRLVAAACRADPKSR